MIRIAIVDDHALVREGLRTFLGEMEDFEIVAEGSTGHDAVKIATETVPDIMLLDLMLPEMSGEDALKEITGTDSKTKVVVLSSYTKPDVAVPVVKSGARGYLTLECSISSR